MLQAADKSQKLHGFNMQSVEDALCVVTYSSSTPIHATLAAATMTLILSYCVVQALSSSSSPKGTTAASAGRIARSRLKEALTSLGDEPLSEEDFDCLMRVATHIDHHNRH